MGQANSNHADVSMTFRDAQLITQMQIRLDGNAELVSIKQDIFNITLWNLFQTVLGNEEGVTVTTDITDMIDPTYLQVLCAEMSFNHPPSNDQDDSPEMGEMMNSNISFGEHEIIRERASELDKKFERINSKQEISKNALVYFCQLVSEGVKVREAGMKFRFGFIKAVDLPYLEVIHAELFDQKTDKHEDIRHKKYRLGCSDEVKTYIQTLVELESAMKTAQREQDLLIKKLCCLSEDIKMDLSKN